MPQWLSDSPDSRRQADRRGVVADWLARTKGDIEVQRIVMRAANYVETGGTVAAAWKLCEGESV